MKKKREQFEAPNTVLGSDSVPLSVVFDSLEMEGGGRGEDFIRRVCAWLQERAHYLSFEVVETLGLQDVVVTFKMKEKVSLIITGYPPGTLPGAVTLSVAEGDFPAVNLSVHDVVRSQPYELCTMDYCQAGQMVTWQADDGSMHRGELMVISTIGTTQNCRIRLGTGKVVTATPASVNLS